MVNVKGWLSQLLKVLRKSLKARNLSNLILHIIRTLSSRGLIWFPIHNNRSKAKSCQTSRLRLMTLNTFMISWRVNLEDIHTNLMAIIIVFQTVLQGKDQKYLHKINQLLSLINKLTYWGLRDLAVSKNIWRIVLEDNLINWINHYAHQNK